VFVPDPAHGRVFGVEREVRSAEVTPGGRLRFDALARYLQEAAEAGAPGRGGRWRLPGARRAAAATDLLLGDRPAMG
jgi:hypothetical protein